MPATTSRSAGRLLPRSSGNADRQENLAYGLRLLGDVLRADKNQVAALAAFRELAAIRQKLAKDEPNNVDRQNNLAFGYVRLASELLAQNNATEAIATYRLALAVRQQLAAAEPDSDAWQRQLASTHSDLAAALQVLGGHADAVKHYREALVIRERLAIRTEREETAAQGKPGAATADALGNVAWGALFVRDFEKALAASRRAADLAPDLIWVQTNLAHALMFLNRTEEARTIYLRFRGQTTYGSTTWQQSVLEDFAIFRRAGLDHSMMETIERSLADGK